MEFIPCNLLAKRVCRLGPFKLDFGISLLAGWKLQQEVKGLDTTRDFYAWNSLASGNRKLHLARASERISSILVSSQLRAMESSLTSR
jgi:hypothetical protein